MTNLELLLHILASCFAGSWLLYLIGGLIWFVANRKHLRGMTITIEWPTIVVTPLAIGWFIYLGIVL